MIESVRYFMKCTELNGKESFATFLSGKTLKKLPSPATVRRKKKKLSIFT